VSVDASGVYLSIPTSNHNGSGEEGNELDGVYLSIPTSNHNCHAIIFCHSWVFICLFLHQTTTASSCLPTSAGCLSVYSYIKPQRFHAETGLSRGVYLSIPTSNHNITIIQDEKFWGVYLSIPTSNHNEETIVNSEETGVYLSIPTSNHNFACMLPKTASGVYLSIPTSNHNVTTLLISSAIGVYLSIPTSNHNLGFFLSYITRSYALYSA